MTSDGWVLSDFGDEHLAKRGSAARGNGGAHEHLPAASGGWSAQ